jgi:hypothetical protein
VFSLSVVLHKLLTSQQLFLGGNDLETLKLVRGMPIPAPSAHNPGVKPALDAVVMRALERDPTKRYRSAGQMGDELEALVLRKSYSTRALARKARELAGVDEQAPPPSMAASVESAPIVIGHEDSSAIVTGSPRRVPPARPPPLPPPTPGTARRTPDPRTWIAAGACLTTVVALGLVWAVLHRPVVVAVPGSSAGARPLPATVRVTVDSDPQGASVAAPALRNGARLGETPLVVELPRGEAPIELSFAKAAFAPLVYRVIPLQDRTVAVRLERAPSSTATAAAAPPAPTATPTPVARAKGPRSTAARHAALAAQRASAVAAGTAPLPRAVAAPSVAAPTSSPSRHSAGGPTPAGTAPTASVPRR